MTRQERAEAAIFRFFAILATEYEDCDLRLMVPEDMCLRRNGMVIINFSEMAEGTKH